MKRFDVTVSLGAVCAGLIGCSAQPDAPEQAAGTVELRLADTPADARCLRVSFEGSRSKVSLLPLSPGSPARFVVDRLPVGLVSVDAAAFDRACNSVSSGSVPRFVLDSPVTVRVSATAVTEVRIELVRNGRVGIEVGFDDSDPAALEPFELAVIGDTPYGAQQLASFATLVDDINARHTAGVVHVGDIKNGSSRCDTAYYETILDHFSLFASPLVYTPGDNEWTDCHRANNGAFDPLERLAVLRETFFAKPGITLGAASPVLSQATIPDHASFVENSLWMKSSVVLATVHVVGSSNGLAPWFGTDTTGTLFDDPDRRLAEVEARTVAALDWIDRAFDLATAQDAAGAVLFMQADTFAGAISGFESIVRALADRARAFAKPVLLVQGDTHTFLVDQPLLAGNAAYGVDDPVPNLTRLVVQGETIGEWLELRVDPEAPGVFSWERRTVGDSGTISSGRLLINEVSSNPNPDWIEFINFGSASADVSGWSFTDNDPTHRYTFPVGTTVAPGGLLVVNENADFSFGLGNADSVILRDASGAIADEHTWTSHVSSNARCPDGEGPLGAATPSKGAPNRCP